MNTYDENLQMYDNNDDSSEADAVVLTTQRIVDHFLCRLEALIIKLNNIL